MSRVNRIERVSRVNRVERVSRVNRVEIFFCVLFTWACIVVIIIINGSVIWVVL